MNRKNDLAAILRAHGFDPGALTSESLFRFTERLDLDAEEGEEYFRLFLPGDHRQFAVDAALERKNRAEKQRAEYAAKLEKFGLNPDSFTVRDFMRFCAHHAISQEEQKLYRQAFHKRLGKMTDDDDEEEEDIDFDAHERFLLARWFDGPLALCA